MDGDSDVCYLADNDNRLTVLGSSSLPFGLIVYFSCWVDQFFACSSAVQVGRRTWDSDVGEDEVVVWRLSGTTDGWMVSSFCIG